MYKRYLIFAVCIMFSFNSTRAQLKRSEWSHGIVLQSNNLVYSSGADAIMQSLKMFTYDDYGSFKYAWLIPEVRYRGNIVQRINFAKGKAEIYPKTKGWNLDWGLNNYAVGYRVGYLSRIIPLGFDLEADYVQDGYKIIFPGSVEKQRVVKRMISTTALLKIRLLKYDENRINPIVELGSSYDYAFHYHDKTINDKDAVNSGFTGIVGLGFTNTEIHVSVSLRYEHCFYNFYNKKFQYEGVPIFDGSKSEFDRLNGSLTFAF
jgi:hypothetical protein